MQEEKQPRSQICKYPRAFIFSLSSGVIGESELMGGRTSALTCLHLSQMSLAAPRRLLLYFTCKQIMEREVCFNPAYSFNTCFVATGKKYKRRGRRAAELPPPTAAAPEAADTNTTDKPRCSGGGTAPRPKLEIGVYCENGLLCRGCARGL